METRLQQFPGETFCKSAGVLFCRCCKQQLSLLKQTLVIHKQSGKHKSNKAQFLEQCKEDDEVKQILSEYFLAHPDEKQASLSPETLLYRWRVVETCMEHGVHLNKVDALRELLERGGERLTASKNLAQFIPKIAQREKDATMAEIKDERGCIIYDGTTRLGEATAALWRQCNEKFILMQRLVAFKTTATHLTGNALYRLLGTIILREMGKDPDDVIADSRDSCSTNGAAERLLMTLLPAMAPNLCVSHVLVGTGQHIKLPTLSLFMTHLIQLLTHSHAFKMTFQEIMGESMPNYSKIRWWSRWALMEVHSSAHAQPPLSHTIACADRSPRPPSPQVLGRCFSRLNRLITALEERGIGDASTIGLRDIYNSSWRELRYELAMIMDLKCFYTATYALEGDGLEGLRVTEMLEEIRSKGRTLKEVPSNMPNLAAVLRHEANLVVGTKLYEYFGEPYNAWYDGEIKKITSDGFAGSPKIFSVKYSDGTEMDSEEHEVRRWLRVHDHALWLKCADHRLHLHLLHHHLCHHHLGHLLLHHHHHHHQVL